MLGIQETRNKDLMIPPKQEKSIVVTQNTPYRDILIPPKQEKSIAVTQNTPYKAILILPKQVKSLTIVTPPYTGKVGRIRVRRTLDNMPRDAEEFYAALSEMDVALRNAVIQELRTASTRAEYTVGTPLIIYAEDKSDVITKAHDAIKHIHDRGDYDEVHNIVITSYARIHSNVVIEELSMCNITPPTTTPKGFNRQ